MNPKLRSIRKAVAKVKEHRDKYPCRHLFPPKEAIYGAYQAYFECCELHKVDPLDIEMVIDRMFDGSIYKALDFYGWGKHE